MGSLPSSIDPLGIFGTAMGSRTYLSCLVGIYAWDLLALLKTERRLVWRNKHWSLLNYLFLVNRYSTVVFLILAEYLAYTNVPPKTCSFLGKFQPIGTTLIILVCGGIISTHLSNLYSNNARLWTFLGSLLILQAVTMTYSSQTLIQIPLPPLIRGCLVAPALNPESRIISLAFWSGPFLFVWIAFGFVVHYSLRISRRSTSFFERLTHDGGLFLLVIGGVSTVNIAFMILDRPDLRIINFGAVVVFNSIMSARLVLHYQYYHPTIEPFDFNAPLVAPPAAAKSAKNLSPSAKAREVGQTSSSRFKRLSIMPMRKHDPVAPFNDIGSRPAVRVGFGERSVEYMTWEEREGHGIELRLEKIVSGQESVD